MLGFGAVGAPVARLQDALNLDPARSRTLVADGLFGRRTRGRVMEFQAARGAAADGVAGPVTLGLLGKFFDLLDHAGKRVVPDHERATRRRIVAIAQATLAAWGWSDTQTATPPKAGPQIALRHMKDAATRERHGGWSLGMIFQIAGADDAARCLRIPPDYAVGEMWAKTGKGAHYPRTLAAEEKWYSDHRNNDVVNYCGIFALYVSRLAGVRLSDWRVGGISANTGMKPVPPKDARPGDVGLMSPSGRNHHFIVIERKGDMIESIDGNAGFFHSIVAQKYRLASPESKALETEARRIGAKQNEPCAFFSAFPA